jgi:DNA-binding transcriptional regulator LsrR (DeoR family)
VVRGINDRWAGVRLEHLARCARAATGGEGRAGVIVLAVGRSKAEVVLECVRGGLVNELIVDHDLAQALAQAP